MKRHLMVLVLALSVLGVQANNGEKKAESPKAINYKEVVSNIKYPLSSKEKGIEGRVLVILKIDQSGKVINHQFKSYPCTELRDAVKEILPSLNFTPAKNAQGEVVDGLIALPINFELTI